MQRLTWVKGHIIYQLRLDISYAVETGTLLLKNGKLTMGKLLSYTVVNLL